MQIKKKYLAIATASILIILLVSYSIMYSLFYKTVFKETMQNQRTAVELNRRMADNFLDSIYYTATQLVSDKSLGEYLSVDSEEPMDIIQTRIAIQRIFLHYATHQIINSTYNYRTTLFLSDKLPIAGSFETYAFDYIPYTPNAIYCNSKIQEKEWFKKTVSNAIYVFLNEETTEICIARKITNNYYIGSHDPNGTAIIVTSVPVNQLENIFSSVPITKNSGYAVLNENGDILYCSNPSLPYEIYDNAWKDSNYGNFKEFTMHSARNSYQVNCCNAEYGIHLLFLTPENDIQKAVRPMLTVYSLIFGSISFVILITLWIVIGRLSRPIVHLSSVVEKIHDTRDFDKKELHVSGDKEFLILENSFNKLIDNINTLIDNIRIQKDREKISQLRALQAQINPHFIFNSMDMVNWLALSRNCDDIAKTVSSIANIMRYSITDADSMVPISMEVANIREFLSVYQLRYDNQLLLDAQLQDENIMIPKFTLQPLVENSVRHAHPSKDEYLSIQIHAYRTNGLTIIEVHDNGKYCNADELNQHLHYEETNLVISSGFGIRNVNERISLHFSGQSGLIYQNEEDYTLTARIILDAQDN